MNSPILTIDDWRKAIQDELKDACKDHPPGNGWFTGPEIASMLGCNKGVICRKIPKQWPVQKFARLTRDGRQMPVAHYKVPSTFLPSSVRTARSGKVKL